MWEKNKGSLRLAYDVLRAAVTQFGLDRADRMAAAVAYRTMFALAPLLLLGIWVLGLVLGGNEAARDRILAEVGVVAGTEISEALALFLANAQVSGDTAAFLGFGLLLWTGSSLFLELQRDLNDIFEVPHEERSGIAAIAVKRGLGFLWVIVFGLALIAVWGLNAVWQFIGGLVPEMLDALGVVFAFFAPLVSLILLPFLLALAFQSLTRRSVRWRAIWWGSFLTAVVFIAAAYLVGLYFRWTTEPNAVNVAGSIFVILLLAFVLSAVFLYGAEVIKVIDDYLDSGTVRSPATREAEAKSDESASAEPREPASASTLLAFVVGVLVGRRNKRR